MSSTILKEKQIEDLDASKIVSGQFADARVSESSVTQHESAINHDALTNFDPLEHERWDQAAGSPTLVLDNSRVTSGNVTQHEGDIDHDALTNFEALEHERWDQPTTSSPEIVLDDSRIQESGVVQYLARRNAIINGNFDIWQRGTVPSGSPAIFPDPIGPLFLADRWSYSHGTGGGTATVTASREIFVPGQTDVPHNPLYYIRTTTDGGTFGANGSTLLLQRIEDVRTFAGEEVTLSFWARSSTPKDLGISFSQVFAAPVSVPVNNGILSTIFPITTSWVKYTLTGMIDPLGGSPTAQDDRNNSLQLNFWITIKGTSVTTHGFSSAIPETAADVDIAQVQVERGSVPSLFEYRPIGEELTLCQRYYSKTYDINIDPGTPGLTPGYIGANSTGLAPGSVLMYWSYPVEMRTIPAITTYDPSGGGTGVFFNALPGVTPVLSVVPGTANVLVSSAPPPLDGLNHTIHLVADAEL